MRPINKRRAQRALPLEEETHRGAQAGRQAGRQAAVVVSSDMTASTMAHNVGRHSSAKEERKVKARVCFRRGLHRVLRWWWLDGWMDDSVAVV